jgi:ABC-type glutathione transport system ATPase component
MVDKTTPSSAEPLIAARGLRKTYARPPGFSRRKAEVTALAGADVAVTAGSTFALVGESGSGKSTLARCLARLEKPTAGEIRFQGRDALALSGTELFQFRRQVQLIFQDTSTALNPRFSAWQIISEPLFVQAVGGASENRRRAALMMEEVGLSSEGFDRRPHEFSGGQRQRLAIARALALEPRVLILDEALAGLDLSIQAQVLNLLLDLQNTRGLTYIFVSHDLGLMGKVANQIAVLHQGRIVEQGKTEAIFAAPQHPQTRALLAAIPRGVH